MKSIKAHDKKSVLAIFVLLLSLAALQSPLWRSQSAATAFAVRTGGATLVSSQTPISKVSVDQTAQATAEIVGDHEILIRGKALGQTDLHILSRDGRASTYRILVQSESAQSPINTLPAR